MTDASCHGFDVRTDTDSEKMTVQLRLHGSGHEWHAMSSYETSSLVDALDSAIWQLRRAKHQRRLTPAQRARYRELFHAHTREPLDETELEELQELDRAVRGAGLDQLKELAGAFGTDAATRAS